jgi:hypothetical protein
MILLASACVVTLPSLDFAQSEEFLYLHFPLFRFLYSIGFGCICSIAECFSSVKVLR